MEINIETIEDQLTELKIIGRLDGVTMPELEQKLETECFSNQKYRILFNLEGLEYISSAGLRVMLLALKKTSAMKGKLVLYGLTSSVQEIFNLSGFSSIYTIVATRDEALSQFK